MTVPRAKQDPSLRRFDLRRHRLSTARGGLSIVAPRSADDILRARHDGHRLDQIPYWADIWPASVALARWLMRGPDLAGKAAVDLGCGIGVAGVAAGARGAQIMFADREADALRFAAFNARMNGVTAPATVAFDWQTKTLPARFDLMLLADVAYEPAHFEPLQRHLQECLTDRGEALLADPLRPACANFLRRLEDRFECCATRGPTSFLGQKIEVQIVRITRR